MNQRLFIIHTSPSDGVPVGFYPLNWLDVFLSRIPEEGIIYRLSIKKNYPLTLIKTVM